MPDEISYLTHPLTLAFTSAVIGLVAFTGALLAGINAAMNNYRKK